LFTVIYVYLVEFSTLAARRFGSQVHKPNISGILRPMIVGSTLLGFMALW